MNDAAKVRDPARLFVAGLLLLFAVIPATPSLAQSGVPQNYQAWSTEEGLPDASVHQVFQASDGYLWIATEGGVARFDGSSFRVFRHETDPAFVSNDISAIAQDNSGALWFGTADGLVKIQASTLRRYTERDGLPSSAVLAIAATHEGSLLVLTSAGLVRYNGVHFEGVSGVEGTVLSLQAAKDDRVWLLTSRGVETYQHGVLKRYSLAMQNIARVDADDTIVGIQADTNGVVWTRSARSLTVHSQGFTRTLQLGRDIPATRLNTLYVDREGSAWIATNRGLFTLRAGMKEVVQPVDFLRSDSILSVMEDREGNVWVGTEASGLHAFRQRKFRSEPAAAGDAVTAGAEAFDGSVWFGTRDEGVHRLRKGVAEQQVPVASLTSPVVLSLAQGLHGDVWVGTPDGLNHIVGNRVQQYTSSNGLPDDFIRSVLVDSHGTAWTGTRRGLARIEGSTIKVLTHENGLGSDSIGPLLESKTSVSNESLPELWIGTSGGLSHLRGTRVQNFAPQQDESKNVVTALAQADDGAIWVGVHGGGLSRFDGKRFSAIASPSLPAEITALLDDRRGHLWVRGARGVYRAATAALNVCAQDAEKCTATVDKYGVQDGMPSDATTAEGIPNLWQAADGEIWFATRKGLAVTDPAHLPVNPLPPPVVIQRFLVDGADVLPGTENIAISTGHSRYLFDYAALSYTLPAKNRYRYKLEGFDRDWIDAGIARSASYTNLPARHYSFRVQAQNNDGVWNTIGAELHFHVQPAFYRRWWFYAVVVLAIGGMAGGLFRLRLRAIRRRFDLVLKERNRMAREIHDTLAQDFVSVSLQLDIATHMLKSGRVEQATSQLQATRKLVTEGLDAARQSIWNLRANAADTLPSMLTALGSRHSEEQHPPRVNVGGAYRKLKDELEKEVFRIAQESLANVYRHAAATEVVVDLRYDPDMLRLSIRDNGRGFAQEQARHMEGHYGLRGMQERALSLGATLTIASTPGAGTAVTLLLPLAGKENTRS